MGYFQSEESAEKFLYVFFKDKDEKYRSRSLRYSDEIQEALSGDELSGGKKSDTINLTLPKSNARREFRIKRKQKKNQTLL